MSKKNVGFTKVSYEILAGVMHLPHGHKIVNVFSDYQDAQQGIFNVVISGPKMPEHNDGERVKQVKIHIKKECAQWTKVETV